MNGTIIPTIGAPPGPGFPSGFTGRIATWEDFMYLYLTQPSGVDFDSFNAIGSWLGNITGDALALIQSRSVQNFMQLQSLNFDFDSERDRNPGPRGGNARTFFCAHDPRAID